MTTKLTRRQLMRRGFWLTVGAAFVPAWARKLHEDMERAEPKPRVFMVSADYSQLELRALAHQMQAYAAIDTETTFTRSGRRFGQPARSVLVHDENGVLRYDSGVRYRMKHFVHDEYTFEEDPNGHTITELLESANERLRMHLDLERDVLNYMALNGITFDRKYIDQLMRRLERHG